MRHQPFGRALRAAAITVLLAGSSTLWAETLLCVEVPETVLVKIDGELVARGPIKVRLEPGMHEITLEDPEGDTHLRQVYSPAKWSVLKKLLLRPPLSKRKSTQIAFAPGNSST